MATKFIQSSHQKGMPAMTRARMRMATTMTVRQSRTMAGTIHESSNAGFTPHRLLVTFVAAVPARKVTVSKVSMVSNKGFAGMVQHTQDFHHRAAPRDAQVRLASEGRIGTGAR